MPHTDQPCRHTSPLRAVAAVGLLLAMLAVVLGPTPASAADDPSYESFEAEVVRLHNQARAAAGLAPLDVHVDLHVDARRWSREMASQGRLMHQSSANGYTPYGQTSCAVADPHWRSCSENVAAGQASPSAVHSSWMGSERHRSIILDPAANRVGVGVWSDGRQLWWTVRYMGGTSVDTADRTRHPQDGGYDPDGPEGVVYRLYRSFFLRDPDVSGFAYWLERYRSGHALPSISEQFALSDEFRARYGSLSDGSYVDLVYRNVLGRKPDPDGRRHWLDEIGRGMTRGRMMIGFSESAEFRSRTSDGVPPGDAS